MEYKPKQRGEKEINGETDRKQSLNNRKKSSQKLFHSIISLCLVCCIDKAAAHHR